MQLHRSNVNKLIQSMTLVYLWLFLLWSVCLLIHIEKKHRMAVLFAAWLKS